MRRAGRRSPCRKGHARAGEDDTADGAKRRDDDEQRNRGGGSRTSRRQRRVVRNACGGQHLVGREHQQIRGVQRQIDNHHQARAREQCAGDGPFRIARSLGGVGDHVPAAEREEPRDQRPKEGARLHGSQCRRYLWGAADEQETQQPQDRHHLGNRQARLQCTAGADADVVDGGQHHDAPHRGEPDAGVAHGDDGSRVAPEDHRDRRDDPGAHVQNIAQPQRKPAAGENISRRNT